MSSTVSNLVVQDATSQVKPRCVFPQRHDEHSMLNEVRMIAQWGIGELNTSRTVQVESAGRTYTLHQEPGSGLVGTSLWDSAVAFLRYLDEETAHESSPLSADRIRGARVVELGAGCGLAGMALAAHGAQVTFTDKPEVMPHLEHNVRENMHAEASGQLRFTPYCWGTDPVEVGLCPPYNFVVATDCLYMPSQVAPFIDALTSLSDSRTVVVLAMERRDEAVWQDFTLALKRRFRVRRVARKQIQHKLNEGEQDAADFLGIFVARKRNRRDHSCCAIAAAEQALIEPAGVREESAISKPSSGPIDNRP